MQEVTSQHTTLYRVSVVTVTTIPRNGNPLMARPLDGPYPPIPSVLEKFSHIITKCCEHRPWFSDFDWDAPEQDKRSAVIGHLTASDATCWEVWRGSALVGILLANRIARHRDAYVHPVFFDHRLVDKAGICQSAMSWCFDRFDLEVLRFEVPTYAEALARFAQKKLGFRYEAEQRPFTGLRSEAPPLTADVASLGSRKHRATRYKGEWHDSLCLSLTRDEFQRERSLSHTV